MNTYDFCNEYLYKPLNIKSTAGLHPQMVYAIQFQEIITMEQMAMLKKPNQIYLQEIWQK